MNMKLCPHISFNAYEINEKIRYSNQYICKIMELKSSNP